MENLPVVRPEQPVALRQAETDAQLIAIWLHGRSIHTQRAYRADVGEFLGFVGRPLHQVRLADIQAFYDQLDAQGLARASRRRKLAAVKSLFAFGHRLGYLPFDVSRPIRLPTIRDTLAERILSEVEVRGMIALEPNPRNRVMLLLLYASGIRVSELCGSKWRHLADRDDDGGQITVLGKRGKTRTILLPNSVWTEIKSLRTEPDEDAPLFRSRKGGPVTTSQVWRIVRKAASRAGISKAVSCHWLRHGHASHALDRGAPISLVQATLGHASVATTGRYLHARPTDSSSRYLPL